MQVEHRFILTIIFVMCLPSPRHCPGILGAEVADMKDCSGRTSGSLLFAKGKIISDLREGMEKGRSRDSW